jgi:hypothetical protein
MEESDRGLIQNRYPGDIPEVLREIVKTLSQDRRSLSRELNLRPPTYKAGMVSEHDSSTPRAKLHEVYVSQWLIKLTTGLYETQDTLSSLLDTPEV